MGSRPWAGYLGAKFLILWGSTSNLGWRSGCLPAQGASTEGRYRASQVSVRRQTEVCTSHHPQGQETSRSNQVQPSHMGPLLRCGSMQLGQIARGSTGGLDLRGRLRLPPVDATTSRGVLVGSALATRTEGADR